jgi:deazaflavin-dependent oxidoreductase (nitroreductase family)
MLGTRFVMLTHLGRRSGLVRRTVLEVVRFEPATRTATVVAAWGERADWFRNVSAHPPLEVWIGRDRFVPELEVLDLEQTRALLEEYQREHPRLARRLFRLTGVEVIDADSAADVASVVRAIRLRPSAPPAAP